MNNKYSDRISEFFQEYVRFPKGFYTEKGNLTDEGIRAATKLLLEQHAFESKEEIKEQAMKDYLLILPDSIFK